MPTKYMQKYNHLIKLGWTIRSEADMEKAFKYVDNVIFEYFLPNPTNKKGE
jgi:hypothetical protein